MATLRAIFCTASGGINLTLQTTGRASGFTYRAPALLLLALLALPWPARAWTSGVWPASNTSPRAVAWMNGSNTIYAKDAWQYDCWSGMIQRASAIDGGWSTNAPPFYRYEQANCATVKWWIVQNCGSFLDQSKADIDGSFDTWLAAHSEVFPVWSVTGLVAYLGLPADFFTNTPYRSLHTSPYGWDGLTNALAALKWTRQQAIWRRGTVYDDRDCGTTCFPDGFDGYPDHSGSWSNFSCITDVSGAFTATEHAGQLEALFSASANDVLALMNDLPACDDVWWFQTTQAADQYEQMGYMLTRANAHPAVSAVPVQVDFYVRDGVWIGPWEGETNDVFRRFEVVAASASGNYTDTIGDLALGFGEEWSTGRLFTASSLFPTDISPPIYDGSQTDSSLGGYPSAYGCFPELESALLAQCTIVASNYTDELNHEVIGFSVNGEKYVDRQDAVLKWNFTYD